jgi:hypothetical protein
MEEPKRRGRPPLKVRDDMSNDANDLIGGSPRQTLRPALREDDPMLRAKQRAAELRKHLGDSDEGTDEFHINASDVPDGWVYEWKRKLTLGAEDPAYMVALARAGWEPVPTSRHPSYMPSGDKYPVIERKGMILMERPAEINEEARDRELRKARQQVRQKEDQLNSAKDGQFDRSNKGDSMVRVSKSYSPIPIPD